MDATDVDEEVRRLLQSGHEASVRRLLVERFDGRVRGLCRAMVGNGATADDLAHDTFERAFEGLSTFRAEASVSTWLLRIARNRCIDHLRSSEVRIVGALGEDVELVRDELSLGDLLGTLERAERALEVLDPEDRALVLLHHVHEVPYAELADTFGVAPGALRMRVARALEKMRSTLERADRGEARPATASPRGRRIQVPCSVLWAALAICALGFVGIHRYVVVPAREAHEAIARQLELSQAEARQAQADLEEAYRSGASEAELQRLRDELAIAQADAAAAAAGDTASIMRTTTRSNRGSASSAPRSSSSAGCMGPICGVMR